MEYDIIASQSAASNITSNGINLDGLPPGKSRKNLSIQAVYSSLNTTGATVRVQHSNDDSNYENLDLNDSTIGLMTLGTGTGSMAMTPIVDLGMKYYRVVYTKNSVNAGTIKVISNVNG
jgi:hypothetical protein